MDNKDIEMNSVKVEGENENSSEGAILAWKDLSVSVKVPSKEKKGQMEDKMIIHPCSGAARPGEILILLGPSGAGKSTTLDVLSGRTFCTSGDLKLKLKDGSIVPPRHLRRVVAYVQQDDTMYASLTVREAITYSARLRLPSTTTDEELTNRVDHVINTLGLKRVADSRVGNKIFRGVSGGERRRVSIGIEIVRTDCELIILDEPTSGLDSEASYQVLKALQHLARIEGKTIIATLHQPSSEIFALCDRVMLLSSGRVVYLGDAKQPALTYFDDHKAPCPSNFNPCDHFLKIINTDFIDEESQQTPEQRKQLVDSLVNDYPSSEQGTFIEGIVTQVFDFAEKRNSSFTPKGYAQNAIKESFILTERAFLTAYRNILLYYIRLAMFIAMAILMGTVWYDVGLDQSQLQNRLSAHFFAVAFLCFMSVAALPALIEEKFIVDREQESGAYRMSSYVISNTVISLPFVLLIALCFTAIAYPLILLQPGSDKVINYILVLFLSLYTMESIAMLIAALLPIFVVSLAIASFFNGLMMVVQGFFVRVADIPDFWIYTFHYFSYQKYGFEALVASDLDGLTFKCEPDASLPDGCRCAYPSTSSNPCEFSGESVLEFFEYEDVEVRDWLLVLLGMIIGYRVILWMVLRFRIGLKMR